MNLQATNQQLSVMLATARAGLEEARICLSLCHTAGSPKPITKAIEARLTARLEAYAEVANELVARNTR